MKYIQPFLYFAKKPQTGFNNVLMGCVCTLAPVIGPIVLLGYRSVVMEHLERDPELQNYPDFKFDHFMRYLNRGLWPFLTNLIVGLGIALPGYAISWLVGILIFQVYPDVLICFAVGALTFVGFVFLLMAFLWPMEIHAMKTQKFNPVAELKFAFGFLRKVGLETVVSIFLFNMLSQVCILVGLLMCFVGVYPAGAICGMAEQHILTQLYLRYLDEGGEPIGGPIEFDDPDRDEPRQAQAVVE